MLGPLPTRCPLNQGLETRAPLCLALSHEHFRQKQRRRKSPRPQCSAYQPSSGSLACKINRAQRKHHGRSWEELGTPREGGCSCLCGPSHSQGAPYLQPSSPAGHLQGPREARKQGGRGWCS